MTKCLPILLFVFSLNICDAQQKYHNDIVKFQKFLGIIADSLYAPFASRNIFPKIRFKPTLSQVKEFESSFIEQYGNAIKKHHELFYLQYHDKGIEDEKWLTDYKDGEKDATQSTKRLKKEYNDYDRFYYGYIGLNGVRYIRIEFVPHKEKWEAIPGAGESQLYNLPPLVYNFIKHDLSLAGWTGEHDE
jgi:hypothetical protein